MSRYPAFRSQHGLSLVELMVAIALGLFVVAGIIGVYIGNKQSYRSGEAMARVQESVRMATEYLSRDLRSAGAYGCVAANLVPTLAYTCSTSSQQRGLKNVLNSGTTTYAYNFALHVQGGDTTTSGSSWSPTLDSTISGASPVPKTGSDVITVRGPDSTAVSVINHGTNVDGSDDLTARLTTEFASGDILMASNCTHATVFQVTGITSAPSSTSADRTMAHAASGTPGNACTALGTNYYNTGGLLMRVRTRTYYVGTSASTGLPSLYRKEGTAAAVELVEGVENLQIEYGVDTNDDGVADAYATASTVDTGGNWPRVASVRVEFVVASPENNVTTEPQVYSFAGATVTPTDRRLRQVASFTVAVRNRLQ
jgi:type IV pilus assembly protein PilW